MVNCKEVKRQKDILYRGLTSEVTKVHQLEVKMDLRLSICTSNTAYVNRDADNYQVRIRRDKNMKSNVILPCLLLP